MIIITITIITITTTIIAKKWKPKDPAVERISKMWYIHTVEHNSVIQRNEVLIYTAT